MKNDTKDAHTNYQQSITTKIFIQNCITTNVNIFIPIIWINVHVWQLLSHEFVLGFFLLRQKDRIQMPSESYTWLGDTRKNLRPRPWKWHFLVTLLWKFSSCIMLYCDIFLQFAYLILLWLTWLPIGYRNETWLERPLVLPPGCMDKA